MVNVLMWLQPLLLYVYPLLLGRGLWLGLLKAFRFSKKESIWHVPTYFALGVSFLFGVALIVRYLLVTLTGWEFHQVYFPLMWAFLLLAFLVNGLRLPPLSRRVGGIVALGILLTTLSYGLWTYRSPYSLNWDWYQHQTLSRLIQQGHFSYFTSHMSDTFGFNSYPPLFHLLISLVQYPLPLTPAYVVAFWQATGWWHLLSVGIASLMLGWALTRRAWAAVLGMIVSTVTFDAMVSMTSYFFLPQTLSAVMFTFMMAKLFWMMEGKDKITLGEILLWMLSLSFMHYLVGGVGALVLGGVWGYEVIRERFPRVAKPFLWLAVLVIVSAVAFYKLPRLPLGTLNQGEARDYAYTVTQKLEVIERSYGYAAYALGMMGILFALTCGKRATKTGLVVLSGLTLATFMDIPYALKLLTLLRFWIVAFMALGVYGFIQYMTSPVVKAVSAGVIGLALITGLVINITYWKAGIRTQAMYSHILPDDIEAARVLEAKYKEQSVFLVSDPATQFFLEGMSGVDTPAGAYMKKPEREVLISALEKRQPADMIQAVTALESRGEHTYDHVLMALSGRTFVWAEKPSEERLAFSTNVWLPMAFTLNDVRVVEGVALQNGIIEVYRSPYISIYQIR